MPDYTDDDVTAAAEAVDRFPCTVTFQEDIARAALAAVAPAIAARALREAAADLPTTWNAYTQPEHLQAWLRARAEQVNGAGHAGNGVCNQYDCGCRDE